MNKKGFTLAEVLITLGVIGVVSAITMPTLISNYKKHSVETKLKRFYTNINQAVQLAEVEHGNKAGWECENTEDFWSNYIGKHLKTVKTENTDDDSKIVYFADGTIMKIKGYSNYGTEIFYLTKSKCLQKNSGCKWGKENFLFAFYPRGNNVFNYGHKNLGVEPYKAYWKGNTGEFRTDKTIGCNSENNHYGYCTAYIQANGWKVPDDYPLKF